MNPKTRAALRAEHPGRILAGAAAGLWRVLAEGSQTDLMWQLQNAGRAFRLAGATDLAERAEQLAIAGARDDAAAERLRADADARAGELRP